MIDVIMVLIVFYLVVGKSRRPDQRSNIACPSPRPASPEKAQERPGHQHLPGGGGHRRGRHSGRLARIHNQGAARGRPTRSSSSAGARELNYGSVASVIRACKQAGVESVRLATERAQG